MKKHIWEKRQHVLFYKKIKQEKSMLCRGKRKKMVGKK